MLNHLVTTATLSLTTLLTVGSIHLPRTTAQEILTCYFNGQPEPCNVIRIDPSNARLVTWLGDGQPDGKTVLYSFYNCVPVPEQSADRCYVEILENNGRTSIGVAMQGEQGAMIWSNNGNTTEIPPVCFCENLVN